MASVPADPLVHRDLDHGIGEYPKQIVASGVVLAKLAFGSGHHRPIEGGNRTVGVRAEGYQIDPTGEKPVKSCWRYWQRGLRYWGRSGSRGWHVQE